MLENSTFLGVINCDVCFALMRVHDLFFLYQRIDKEKGKGLKTYRTSLLWHFLKLFPSNFIGKLALARFGQFVSETIKMAYIFRGTN